MKNKILLQNEIIGLIPAGGQASRISPLPCSKELYPVGFRSVGKDKELRPKVVCHYLLEKMQYAGISQAFIVLRNGKWDIPAYFGDGKMLNMHLAYLMMGLPYGVPYTLDQAYPFLQNATVAFGFPDILFQNENAFIQLLTRQAETKADIVLGLFSPDKPHKKDMVDVDDKGKIKKIVIKPHKTELIYTWCIAVWTSTFTHFLHKYVTKLHKTVKNNRLSKKQKEQQELTVGNIIQYAIHNNLHAEGVKFPDETCLDIGTPDDLVRTVRSFDLLQNYIITG